jgi:hypothetical protein
MATTSNKKVLKSVNKYICYFCDYKTNVKQHYDKHNLTSKHILATLSNKKVLKSVNNFICEKCDYITDIKQHYEKHITSKKHNTKLLKSVYQCEYCYKEFNDRTGLWRHKKKCNNYDDTSVDVDVDNYSKLNLSSQIFIELMKQNSDFKELLIEQHKYILEQNKQNTEFKELLVEQNKQNQNLQNHFIELAKEKSMNNCNNNIHTTNNTNNNNNHFNLQFFLNETCKNAMNISDFIEQIHVSLSDLENTGRLGYAEGITRIFIKGLKELEVSQRPIHCSDGKRETLYIKEGDIWEKDDINKSKLTTAIKKVAHKNMRKITDWVNVYPNCKDSESNKNDLYLKIVSNSMSGITDEEAENNYNKIKRNIIKEVVINK